MIKILHLIADGYTEFNSSNFRVSIPATAVQKSNKAQIRLVNITHWLKQTEHAKYYCAWADVIVLQRVLVAESIDHTKYWTQKGKAVVIDFDDAYDRIRKDNAAWSFWSEGQVDVSLPDGHKYKKTMKPHPIKQFTEGLQYVTAITTPSKILCRDWQHHTPAFYLPNYLDIQRYQKAKKRTNDRITIGWGGSLSHVPSFSDSGVEEGLAQLFSERKDIQFLLVGDKRVLERLPIPKDQLIYSQYTKFSDWPTALMRYDIGIAPLFDAYDCRRSHLKVMEYVGNCLPFVATKSAVYQDFFDANGGLFVNQGELDICNKANPEGWYEALQDVVANIERYQHEIEIDSEEYTHIYDVNKNVDNIIEVYQQILNVR